MKKFFIGLIAAILILPFSGCTNKNIQPESGSSVNTNNQNDGEENGIYKKITSEEAKNIMDTETDFIILDVRTESEYAEGHIKDAVLITDSELKDKVQNVIPDKSKKILVYCRSGRRSSASAKELIKLGYTNVLDFGGIIDWPYEIVK